MSLWTVQRSSRYQSSKANAACAAMSSRRSAVKPTIWGMHVTVMQDIVLSATKMRHSYQYGQRRHEEANPQLPPGYYLERDPDLLTLHRPDGSFVAAFSVSGAIWEAVERVAWEDHRVEPTPEFMDPRGERRARRR